MDPALGPWEVPRRLLAREAADPSIRSPVLAVPLLSLPDLGGSSFPLFLSHMTFMGRNFPDSCSHRFFQDKRRCSLLFL